MTAPLLAVKNLQTSFFTDKGEVRAVRDVSFNIIAGQTLALVGESGCGKSATALSIMRLIDAPGRIVGGQIMFQDQDLVPLAEPQLRVIRGGKIGMIFQEPMTSLNPVFPIGDQISEALKVHLDLSDQAAQAEVVRLLEKVGISSAAQRMQQYPHELSGGMKQRVMIAMALACRPALLIADEPTTALDVTIQAQILELLKDLQAEMGMAILLITHNLGVVAQFAQEVAVMYAGKIVEQTDVQTLFRNPLHPYTTALLQALPRPDRRAQRLMAIPGTVPSPLQYPAGCAFASRCPEVLEGCRERQPGLQAAELNHTVSCWLYQGLGVRD